VRRQELQTALAGLAHEVRTPLNGILVLAELLAASDLPERERGWATALKSAAEHLANLTTVVVDGARADLGALIPRRERFAPRELAAALSDSLSARAVAKGLTAETGVDEGVPALVLGDPVLIRAAVENLLDNAVKFTERGRVSLKLEAAATSKEGVRLAFTVADEGVGLSASDMRRLFRPFAQANARTARRYGGAGLGLAFARQVARAMGGDLTVTSELGAGSRFRFEAEVAAVLESGEASATAPGPEGASARALRVLCAEDNPFGRAVVKAMLAPLGHSVDFVSSGEAAVAAVDGGGYDLVLMDVVLPGVDGIEATRRIRAIGGPAAATPVVGISGRSDNGDEAAARSAGMNAYLVKPVSLAALVAVLSGAASG